MVRAVFKVLPNALPGAAVLPGLDELNELADLLGFCVRLEALHGPDPIGRPELLEWLALEIERLVGEGVPLSSIPERLGNAYLARLIELEG